MSRMTVETTITRRYLRNLTKDEIIEHVMRLLDENDGLEEELQFTRAKEAALRDAHIGFVQQAHSPEVAWTTLHAEPAPIQMCAECPKLKTMQIKFSPPASPKENV